MASHIIHSAKRCIQCKHPPCEKGCPVAKPIKAMIRMFLDGEIHDAGIMLFENNPLSVICGMICPHDQLCEGHCVLNRKSEPVNIGGVERYVSGVYLNRLSFERPEPRSESVAIIGSGPAGLSLALILARKGYPVTLFEGHDRIGGVMRYGIPDFRLPKSILEQYADHLSDLGVRVRPNTLIGKNITLDELFRDGFRAVFIGTGVWTPRKIGIAGESLGHVHFAIDYLRNPDVYSLGRRVIIVGAGNVAMDVARTAIRKGVEDVCILARRGPEEMSATPHEIEMAKVDGVRFEFYKQPEAFTLEGIRYSSTGSEAEGPAEGFLEADAILVAVSQSPRDLIVSHNPGIAVDERGLVMTDDAGRTTRKGVFASGDVVTGARTVVEAVQFTKKVAEAIEDYFQSESPPEYPVVP